jgi:hypothetical protein
MSNNLLIERALHGVFNTTSYITFGTTDDPFPYPHKDVNLLWLSLSKAHQYNLLWVGRLGRNVPCFELAFHRDLVSLSSEWINMIKENFHEIRLVMCKQLVATVDNNVHS